MTHRRIKKILREGIPEVDYNTLRFQTLNRIRKHEDKKRRNALYFVPRSWRSLFLAILFLGVYGLLQDAILLRSFLPLLDNMVIIGIVMGLVVYVNPRFLGVHKPMRYLVRGFRFMRMTAVKIPSVAWSLVKKS